VLEQLADGYGTVAAEAGQEGANGCVERNPPAVNLLHDQRRRHLLRDAGPDPALTNPIGLARLAVGKAVSDGALGSVCIRHNKFARKPRPAQHGRGAR